MVYRWRPATVLAVVQPDVVGPAGVFEGSVTKMMAAEEGMTMDVAEMLVAAQMMSAAGNDAQVGRELEDSLRFMDLVQRGTADQYDQTYDDFLDLYPNWRTYLLSEDPERKEAAFAEYKKLVDRYTDGQKDLIRGLGYLLALQKALLPSNVYEDPYQRIPSAGGTAAVLKELAENMQS